MAAQFANIVQVREKAEGDKTSFRTRKTLDHAGLEMMLRDEIPSRVDRNRVRELIAFLNAKANGDKPKVEDLPENLDTKEKILDAWERIGVRRWFIN